MPESNTLSVPEAGDIRALSGSLFALDAPLLDEKLGGGLARGRLHEVYPADEADIACTSGFGLMLAIRATAREGTIVWITEDRLERRYGRFHAPGLAELGADPSRILFVRVPDEKALLRTAGDVVRSPAVGTMVIAPIGPAPGFDLTATRRLTLFAERSGVTVILLRACAPLSSSAAATRWCVTAARSTALEADAPGHPALIAELVRRRGGAPLAPCRLEWDRDARSFQPPLPGDLAAGDGGEYLASG